MIDSSFSSRSTVALDSSGAEPVSIAVVGSGYVGLVAAVCFAEMGHEVVCVDNDERKVNALPGGDTLIHEAHLPELLNRYRNTRVCFTSDLAEATRESRAIFIAVGNPIPETQTSYVEAVASEIARSITSYKVIVEKSTVPVYTNEWIRRVIERDGVHGEMSTWFRTPRSFAKVRRSWIFSNRIASLSVLNTYGPRLQASDGRVISNLMTQALGGLPLTIYGEGRQTRSFCYVMNPNEGIVRLSQTDEHAPVNIGNDVGWTILECAREVLSVTGATVEIRFQSAPQDDPTRRRPILPVAAELAAGGHAQRRLETLTPLFLSLHAIRAGVKNAGLRQAQRKAVPFAGHIAEAHGSVSVSSRIGRLPTETVPPVTGCTVPCKSWNCL